MTEVVVADAGPLIGLARIGYLELLRQLYDTVAVPPQVVTELRLSEGRPGSQVLQAAMDAGWLKEKGLQDGEELWRLSLLVDPGEAEAILLAEQVALRFLLIDDQRGRQVATQRGIPVVGTSGVLIIAKRQNLINEVRPLLESLSQQGYRLSRRLRDQILTLANEGP